MSKVQNNDEKSKKWKPQKGIFANKRRNVNYHVVYHPNSSWWEPPLSAWVPSSNRQIFLIYFCFITGLTLLARFTTYCGTPSTSDRQQFCADGWLFDTDHILKFISAGMFFLVAFRGSNSYEKFYEGRRAWGEIWKVSVSQWSINCIHIILLMTFMTAFCTFVPF